MLVAACMKSSPNRLSSVVSPNDCSVSARSIMLLPKSVKRTLVSRWCRVVSLVVSRYAKRTGDAVHRRTVVPENVLL